MKKFKWESQTSKKHQGWDGQVVLAVGKTTVTRKEYVEAKHSHPAAVSRLNRRIDLLMAKAGSPEPKSLRALSRRITLDKFYAIGGLGEEALVAFMVAMELRGIDSNGWYNSTETLEANKRRVKREQDEKTKERRKRRRARNRRTRQK